MSSLSSSHIYHLISIGSSLGAQDAHVVVQVRFSPGEPTKPSLGSTSASSAKSVTDGSGASSTTSLLKLSIGFFNMNPNCYPTPYCSCCECKGIRCLIPHPGHSHETPSFSLDNLLNHISFDELRALNHKREGSPSSEGGESSPSLEPD